VLVDKVKHRPNWVPNSLAEVSDEKVFKDFFDAESPLTANAPHLSLAKEAGPVRRNYALPSEDEIGQLVLGSHPTSGGKSLTLDDLLARLRRLWGDKHGLREKVLEVVSRRCKVLQDPERHGYLQWVH
jgi:3-hydroxyisobutyryl-CoA hydrolase